MDAAFQDFLINNTIEVDIKDCTHMVIQPRSYHNVPLKRRALFWKDYCGLCADEKVELGLAEILEQESPFIVNFSFPFHDSQEEDDEWTPYDDKLISHIVYIYQQAMRRWLILKDQEPELMCVIMEPQSSWQEEGEDGTILRIDLRIQFPYCRCDLDIQRLIHRECIKYFREKGIVSCFNSQPIGDWDKWLRIYNRGDPVLMYGSTYQPGIPCMKLLYVWGVIESDMLAPISGDEEAAVPIYSIDVNGEVFPIHNHDDIYKGIVDSTIFIGDTEHWLPLIFSTHYYPLVTLSKRHATLQENEEDEDKAKSRRKNRLFKACGEETTLAIAERMLTMINDSRLLDEASWTDIGRALFNAAEGGPEGLKLWIRQTKEVLAREGGKHNTTSTSWYSDFVSKAGTLYEIFNGNPLTVKTLAWFAREDNPKEYQAWHKKWIRKHIEQALSASHTDVACALYHCYWLDFVCASISRSIWYVYRGHRWCSTDKGVDLSRKISSGFLDHFRELRTEYSKSKGRDEAKDKADASIKKMDDLIRLLKSVPFKRMLMREAGEFFENERFDELVNSNPDTMGIFNGVLEALKDRVVFRRGKPEDYISRCSLVSYNANWTRDHPIVQECLKWFGQVYPDPGLLQHFLRFSASCIRGRNADKIFSIWSGEGDNSKSMIVKLFEATFGPYCIKFPISIITGRRTQSSSATPEVARSKATKIAFLEEPDDDEVMKKSFVKATVGGDSHFARLLHDNGGEVKTTYKIVLVCNVVPTFIRPDKALKNRVEILPHLTTYSDNPPKDIEEQKRRWIFKKDPNFEMCIPFLAPGFLWVMVDVFPEYARYGLAIPELVKKYTNNYWNETDIYSQFTAEAIRQSKNSSGERDVTAKLTVNEVYSEFKSWYQDAYPKTRVPERAVMRSELNQRWGYAEDNAWYGITFSRQNAGSDTNFIINRALRRRAPA